MFLIRQKLICLVTHYCASLGNENSNHQYISHWPNSSQKKHNSAKHDTIYFTTYKHLQSIKIRFHIVRADDHI
jgi:hypothetical protein